MTTQQVMDTPAEKRPRRPGVLVLTVIVALLAVSVPATLMYFSFAKAPVAVANYVIVGPECEAQPATRAEAAYLTAQGGAGAGGAKAPSKTEFAGIKFYRNIPWGQAEQTAPVGAR